MTQSGDGAPYSAKPVESGPRCFIDWSMRVISDPISRSPLRLMIPAMPHISGSSCESGRRWAVAGAAWQGRRPAGIPLGFQGLRTPPGGDQRSIQRRSGLQEGPLREHLQVLVALPVGDGGERLERGAERVRHLLDLDALLEQLVRVALLRLARVDLVADPVEAGYQQRGGRQVRVAGGVDAAVLEPPARRDANGRRAVLPAPVLVDRRPEAGVPHAAVGVDRRVAD